MSTIDFQSQIDSVSIKLTTGTRNLVVMYFRVYEPDLVCERKAGRLKRRRFWAAGVNDMLDPFPGRIHWIKVWWTNSNPKLILSYYLEFVENFKRKFSIDITINFKLLTRMEYRYASCFSE